MTSNQKLDEMETLFLALADKTRLRILNLMREGEVCVYLFTDILGESQPKISRHLAYLRNAGIVEARREGKLIHYRIVCPQEKAASFILEDTLGWLSRQSEMQTEYNKLAKSQSEKFPTAITNNIPKQHIYAQPNVSVKKDELEIFML